VGRKNQRLKKMCRRLGENEEQSRKWGAKGGPRECPESGPKKEQQHRGGEEGAGCENLLPKKVARHGKEGLHSAGSIRSILTESSRAREASKRSVKKKGGLLLSGGET